ncbi:sulfotransferase domain-containing protein [Salinisphaera orenii]|uniref:sulfotransferase domain-containing protein n=1 Tax=Salinisphaera orenii TaxID=856731 RepID=UPI0013A5FD33|nr:hypothetical protein [Salifodinibacter halophilus]
MPDRYRRAAIVAATGVLPARARTGLRRRWLAHHYSELTKRADVVTAVHPKCGGTWLRAMIFRVYQQHYGLETRRVVKSDEFARLDSRLPRFVFSNGHYSYESAVAETLDTLAVSDQPRALMLMARHPGDIAVSWYHQFTRRITARKRELIAAEMAAPIDPRSITRAAFIANEEIGLPALIRYHNQWAARMREHPHGLIVRYEDLHTAPAETLARVMAHLGEHVDDTLIDEAVDFAGADNLRRLESERYFKNSGLRQKKSGDPDTVKVRRARVGSFRDDLEPAEADWVDDMIRARLDPVFGYDTSLDGS